MGSNRGKDCNSVLHISFLQIISTSLFENIQKKNFISFQCLFGICIRDNYSQTCKVKNPFKIFVFTGCAYADGTSTSEEAVLTAYARGYALHKAKDNLIKGMMAAVGLPKEQVYAMLPDGVYIACQNSSSSVTVSGPEKDIKSFVEKLQSEGIFARLVESSNTAFHSKYVHEAGKHLLDFLRHVIEDPQPRSKKWISSSVSESQRYENWANYNGPEYHHNNFCNTVLFDQIFEHIPDNAIVIEVAPHGLLQAILKRELPKTVTILDIVNKKSSDIEQYFLSTIGKYVKVFFFHPEHMS